MWVEKARELAEQLSLSEKRIWGFAQQYISSPRSIRYISCITRNTNLDYYNRDLYLSERIGDVFTGRKAEMTHLETLYASEHAELFILYGRKRVGKTELLREFSAGKPHITFFIATLSSDNNQLAAFSQDIYQNAL